MDLDRSSVVLYGSRVGISLVGFLSTVYFARELGAAGLGLYFTFETVVNVLGVFARFGADNAVIKRMSESDSDRERGRFLTAALLAVVLPFVLVSLGLVGFRDTVGALFNSGIGVGLVPLLVVVIGIESAGWVLASALRGERRIATSAGVEVCGEVARVGLSVALVLGGGGAVALVYGLLVGQFVRAVAAAGLVRTPLLRPTRETFGRLVSFSKYTAGMNVSHLAYSWFDTLALAVFVSSAAVGVYEAAWRVSVVVMLASSSIGAALAPSVSNWHANGEIERIEAAVSESLTYALLLVVPAVVGVAILGGAFMRNLYRFDTGGFVLLLLVAEKLFQAVKDIVQSTLLGTERQRLVFWTNTVAVGANIVLNVLLVPRYGLVGAAVATTSTAGTAALAQTAALDRAIAVRFDVRAITWQAVAAAAMGVAVYVTSRAIPPTTTPRLLVLVALGVVVYGGAVLGHEDTRTRLVGLVPSVG
ncbi:flippase [Haloarcula brevis]|uniref:flippase n=1 Tax=Haloarcula brevis TaxID=3111453 RepID=UPI00300F6E72